MVLPYIDEDPNLAMTRKGLRVAENERPDSVTAVSEKQALESGDTEEALDDTSYPKGDSRWGDPELSAVK
jgi:hypothetical protein